MSKGRDQARRQPGLAFVDEIDDVFRVFHARIQRLEEEHVLDHYSRDNLLHRMHMPDQTELPYSVAATLR